MRSYRDILKILNIETLEYRRLEANLVMVFRLLHGIVDIKFANFFKIRQSTYNLRGHRYNLRSDRKNRGLFPSRVISIWNKLPEAVVERKSLASFKSALKKLNLRNYANLLV